MTKPVRVVELFAGVGGFRYGLEQASPVFQTVWANQWEPGKKTQHAYDCYVDRYGENHRCVNENIALVKENVPSHDLLVGGFPCFVAGTLILAEKGWTPIEEIEIGSKVLTHTGSWQKVTSLMNRLAEETYTIRGHGVPNMVTTAEHPLYARKRKRTWYPGKVYEDGWTDPGWVEAKDIEKHHLAQVLPAVKPNRYSEDFWWLIGRYLADGWTTTGKKGKKDSRLVICCSHQEAEYLEKKIASIVHATRVEEKSITKFIITKAWFVDFVKPLGKYAYGKGLTKRELTLSKPKAKALLDGWLSGDGHTSKDIRLKYPVYRGTTVSKSLALSMALLSQRAYGVVASVHISEVPKTKIIEGRTVNQRTNYIVAISISNKSSYREGIYGWKRVKKVTIKKEQVKVFNLSVERDESYVADGAIVHNCQNFSIAASGAKGIEGEKGVLWWEIRDILEARRPAYVLLENVDRLLISPSSQRGKDFGIMLRCLNDLGYFVEWRVINAAEYGHAQRRRRVFIFAVQGNKRSARIYRQASPYSVTYQDGLFASAFPVKHMSEEYYAENVGQVDVSSHGQGDIMSLSQNFLFPFQNSGVMVNGIVSTVKVAPVFAGKPVPLSRILEKRNVDERFFLGEDVSRWEYLKGRKRIPRVKPNGEPYVYSEGPVPFPDPADRPGRTMLTSEASVNRSTHVVVDRVSKELRLLTPLECERLNEFPDGWTDTGMPEKYRYFVMGNALVTGIVTTLGAAILELNERK